MSLRLDLWRTLRSRRTSTFHLYKSHRSLRHRHYKHYNRHQLHIILILINSNSNNNNIHTFTHLHYHLHHHLLLRHFISPRRQPVQAHATMKRTGTDARTLQNLFLMSISSSCGCIRSQRLSHMISSSSIATDVPHAPSLFHGPLHSESTPTRTQVRSLIDVRFPVAGVVLAFKAICDATCGSITALHCPMISSSSSNSSRKRRMKEPSGLTVARRSDPFLLSYHPIIKKIPLSFFFILLFMSVPSFFFLFHRPFSPTHYEKMQKRKKKRILATLYDVFILGKWASDMPLLAGTGLLIIMGPLRIWDHSFCFPAVQAI